MVISINLITKYLTFFVDMNIRLGGIQMFEYIRHTLAQAVILLFLGNIALLLVPSPLRKSILGTFRFAMIVGKFTTNLLKKVGKEIVANSKEIESPTKKTKTRKQPTSKSKGKVIQFPNAK